MKQSLRLIRKKVVELGKLAAEIDDKINRPMAEAVPPIEGEGIVIPTIRFDRGRIHLDKEKNSTWVTLKKTRAYPVLLKIILESKKSQIGVEQLERILCEFVYEIIEILPRKKRREDAKWLDTELKIMANLLVEDITSKQYSFNAIAPIFSLSMSVSAINLGKYGTLRRAYYSEKIDFTPCYPKPVFPYGPERFDYILELERSHPTKEASPELVGKYVNTTGNLIMLLRLLCGGGVGVEYLHVWSEPVFDEPKPGTRHVFGGTTVSPLRALKPSEEKTIITNINPKRLERLLTIMDSLPINSFFLRALRRFGTALESKSTDDRILDCVTALECLFGSRSHVRIRVGNLLNDEFKKESIISLLDDCWKARHVLAHGGSIIEAETEAGGDLEKKSLRLHKLLHLCLIKTFMIGPHDRSSLRRKIDKMAKTKAVEPSYQAQHRKDSIPIDVFNKLDLRIGKVVSCERVSSSANLLKIDMDLGTYTTTSVMTYNEEYPSEKMEGSLVLFIANLEPKHIFGVRSTGMLLEAEHVNKPGKWIPIIVEDIPLGSRIA